MKKITASLCILSFCLFVLSSFFVNKTTAYVPVPELYGKWNVDSSGFINNGIKGTTSPPIIKTIWTFNKDGSYTSSANSISGSYKLNGKTITLKAMGMDMEYLIDKLDAKKLVLTSIISQGKTHDMRSVSYLSRIK